MHFRFFSASMGRFQKPDSNFENPVANPQGWNLYSYVKGNPVNFNDPTGHQEKLQRSKSHPQFPQWLMSGRDPASTDEDAPLIDNSGVCAEGWGVNTLSNLGQTMTPQATGQAAQTSTPAFGGKYSLNLDPLGIMPELSARAATPPMEPGLPVCTDFENFALIAYQLPRLTFGLGRVAFKSAVALFTKETAETALSSATEEVTTQVIFNSEHCARHLIGTTLTADAVETAIRQQIVESVGKGTASSGFWGRVSINGVTVEYRAWTLQSGTISVGTYYIPKG